MNDKQSKSGTFFLMLPLLLAISTYEATAAEIEVDSNTETKIAAPEKTCITFSQLKPGQKKEYSKCIKHTYNKGRCKKRSNVCLK